MSTRSSKACATTCVSTPSISTICWRVGIGACGAWMASRELLGCMSKAKREEMETGQG